MRSMVEGAAPAPSKRRAPSVAFGATFPASQGKIPTAPPPQSGSSRKAGGDHAQHGGGAPPRKGPLRGPFRHYAVPA